MQLGSLPWEKVTVPLWLVHLIFLLFSEQTKRTKLTKKIRPFCFHASRILSQLTHPKLPSIYSPPTTLPSQSLGPTLAQMSKSPNQDVMDTETHLEPPQDQEAPESPPQHEKHSESSMVSSALVPMPEHRELIVQPKRPRLDQDNRIENKEKEEEESEEQSFPEAQQHQGDSVPSEEREGSPQISKDNEESLPQEEPSKEEEGAPKVSKEEAPQVEPVTSKESPSSKEAPAIFKNPLPTPLLSAPPTPSLIQDKTNPEIVEKSKEEEEEEEKSLQQAPPPTSSNSLIEKPDDPVASFPSLSKKFLGNPDDDFPGIVDDDPDSD